MTKSEFLATFASPLPNAVLKKWPNGHIRQYWTENPGIYGPNQDDMDKMVCGHTGIDIATFENDDVCAAHDGTVWGIQINPQALGGNVVWLRSNVFTDGDKSCYVITAYGHLNAVLVSAGQRVTKGQVIGKEGNTGFVVSGGTPYWGNAPAGKGVHLHFGYTEFLANGKPRFPNCMHDTSDPLLAILSQNPDYSGIRIVLENMASYLRYLQRSLNL